MATIPMPSRGERIAPKFDPKQPRELRRYFSDLELLFVRSTITDEQQKKVNACRYVDVDTSELWESLPEFANNTITYIAFCAEVYKLYPGSEANKKWSVADMDKLVGERSRLGVITIGDLGDYYRQFLAITTFLKGKSRLSDGEQSRAFIRGFQTSLWLKIEQRLQLTMPTHDQDDPYPLTAVHGAAQYVLHGTSTDLLTPSPATTAESSTSPAPTIKTEDMTSMFERLTETFIKALAQQQGRPTSDERVQRQAKNISEAICNFCGVKGHMMRECPLCQEYVTAGKCKRNIDNKIVLPSGAFLPRDIPGQYMKERFDEYHRRNPGQMGTAQLMYGILANEIRTKTLAAPNRAETPRSTVTKSRTFEWLSEDERIEGLEREVLYLKRRGADKRKQNEDKEAEVGKSGETEEIPVPDATNAKKTKLVPEVVIPVATKPKKATKQPAPVVPEVDDAPEHPFAGVPAAGYAPPKDRNFAAPPKPAPAKKQTPAYRTTAPVYDGKIAQTVFDRIMSTLITLPQGELLSLSPELCSLLRQAVSPRRGPTKDSEVSQKLNMLATDEDIADAIDDLEPDYDPTSIFSHSNADHLPADARIIPDIYDVYLKSLPPGHEPERLIVAKESSALRAIKPIIDNQAHIESILDPGSQIIAMSEEVCTNLQLVYDPSIILTMQSANGELDCSLGLARNVPLRIGEITLYVQIHVIRSPAYDILLGRPFDTLTESIVRNYANENQMITIHDPNTGKRATVPTAPRGRSRRVMEEADEDFHNSRI
jgi:hypothetical protein